MKIQYMQNETYYGIDHTTDLVKPLLSKREVAHLFNVHPNTIYNWTCKGYLVNYRIGNRYYYKRKEIMEGLVRNEVIKISGQQFHGVIPFK